MARDLLMNVLPIASMIAVGVLLCACAWRYFRAPEALPGARAPMPLRWLLPRVLLLLLLSRALIYLTAMVGTCLESIEGGLLSHPPRAWFSVIAGAFRQGSNENFFRYPLDAWMRWDGNHYIGLAKNWYVNEGDPMYHIVFYPLYPLLVRLLDALLGNTYFAAFLLSNMCLLGCGWALFRLVEMEQGCPAAHRSLIYLMFCPLSLFFSVTYSESLFLLLTLLSVLMARRRNIALAVLFGALASGTRMLGLVTAVPVFYECLAMARERAGDDRSAFRKMAVKYFAVCCLILLGFLAYLLLNYRVTGDPFTFLVHQREHWSQRFGSLYGSVRYTIVNAFDRSDRGNQLGIWIPQLASMALVIALMLATVRRLRPGDATYALMYFYIALAPTWLLSGPRYLGAMYALYPMLALITRRRWQHIALTALLALGCIYISYFYAVVGSVL